MLVCVGGGGEHGRVGVVVFGSLEREVNVSLAEVTDGRIPRQGVPT